MKKIVVYIDGENLLHRLIDTLVAKKIIGRDKQFAAFDFKHLLGGILPKDKNIEVRYYGTRIKASGLTGKARQKALDMIEMQRRFKKLLERQGIVFVMCGTLQWREGNRCVHCGKKTPSFQEKGVDVQLAVDIASEAKKVSRVVLVSSDSDLLPAVRLARGAGCSVEYVIVDHQINWALSRSSDRTHDIPAARVVESYKRLSS